MFVWNIIAFFVLFAPTPAEPPSSSSFTYQGQLRVDGLPHQGSADLQFSFFVEEAGGTPIAAPLIRSNVTMVHGMFQVTLDAGATIFADGVVWLEVAVRAPHDPTGSLPFAMLSPRQPMTAAPRSLQTRGVFVEDDGRVGVGTNQPSLELRMHVVGGDHDTAVRGQSTDGGVFSVGVFGQSQAVDGTGVMGQSNTGDLAYGVWGRSSGGFAGWFDGAVHVNGVLTESIGAFMIDHPLDPENHWLLHSFVESPDMKNVYDGIVVLDEEARAVVQLPVWFEALNRDFRYQLTAIGSPAPQLHVAQEVAGNQFVIAGGAAGQKVSWQVTGIRHDAYAEAHRIPVEKPKRGVERGRYSNPEVFGKPESMGISEIKVKALDR